jgi:outer membrane cobalamin receptor
MLFSTIENVKLTNQPEIISTGYLQFTDSFFQGDLKPTFRIEGRYLGERKSAIVHPYYYEVFQENLSSILILNASAILNFGNLKVYFMLENVLDQKYQLLYGYPMNQRTLHYGLRWEFWN